MPINPNWSLLVIALWLLPVLAAALPAVTRAVSAFWRGRDTGTVLLIVALATWCTVGVGRAIASKGGGETNPPPAAVRGVIRLYHEDATGRLVPLDAQIKGVTP